MLFLKKHLLAVKVKKNNRQNSKKADNVQKEPARKQKFKNLDVLMNENNYLGIHVQPKIVFRYQDAKKLWRSNSTPTRKTPSCNNVEPKTSWNILQNHVDVQSESRHHSSRSIFSFCIVKYTNQSVKPAMERFAYVFVESDKYTHFRLVDNNDILAYTGLLYLRGALIVNLETPVIYSFMKAQMISLQQWCHGINFILFENSSLLISLEIW